MNSSKRKKKPYYQVIAESPDWLTASATLNDEEMRRAIHYRHEYLCKQQEDERVRPSQFATILTDMAQLKKRLAGLESQQARKLSKPPRRHGPFPGIPIDELPNH
jgi:hypothetical protein